jgi:hypothetical protein
MKKISALLVISLLVSSVAAGAPENDQSARLEMARSTLRQAEGLSPSRLKILQEMLSLSELTSSLWRQYAAGVSLVKSLGRDLAPQDRAIVLTMTSEIDVAAQLANSTFYLFYLQNSFGEPTAASSEILSSYCRYSAGKLLDVAGGMKIFRGQAENEQLKEFVRSSIKDVELCAGRITRLSSFLRAYTDSRLGE